MWRRRERVLTVERGAGDALFSAGMENGRTTVGKNGRVMQGKASTVSATALHSSMPLSPMWGVSCEDSVGGGSLHPGEIRGRKIKGWSGGEKNRLQTYIFVVECEEIHLLLYIILFSLECSAISEARHWRQQKPWNVLLFSIGVFLPVVTFVSNKSYQIHWPKKTQGISE